MDVAKPAGFRAQGRLGNVSTKVIAKPTGFRAQGTLGQVVAKVKRARQLLRRKGD